MALLVMIARKIFKNRSLMLLLLLGLLISMALLGTIPMYTGGALSGVLQQKIDEYRQVKQTDPNWFSVYYAFSDSDLQSAADKDENTGNSPLNDPAVNKVLASNQALYGRFEQYIKKSLPGKLPAVRQNTYAQYQLSPRTIENSEGRETECALLSITDIDNHVKLTSGRLPNRESGGIYETLISDGAPNILGVKLGQVYTLTDTNPGVFGPVKVRPVGTFSLKDPNSVYWENFNSTSMGTSMLLEESDMLRGFLEGKQTQISNVQWIDVFNPGKLSSDNVNGWNAALSSSEKELLKISQDVDTSAPLDGIINEYENGIQQLTANMWALITPSLVLLFFFLLMVSSLIVQQEKSEIALLLSRGAGRMQIVAGYLIEGLLLGIAAMLIAPFLSFLICRMLSGTKEFMQLSFGAAMPIRISVGSYLYMLPALVLFLAALLIPAFLNSNRSIVEQSHTVSRWKRMPVWQRHFLDILLLAVCAYGYYLYQQKQALMEKTNLSAAVVGYDPSLFFLPIFFVLGLCLFCLRLYPYFLQLITLIGKRQFPPSGYLAMQQVGRSATAYDFAIILLTLTLSIGIYSENTARTINQNSIDNIRYSTGADLVTQSASWAPYNPSALGQTPPPPKDSSKYTEPDYSVFQKLPGAEATTKVLTNSSAALVNQMQNTSFMAIEPDSFGKVAWTREGLMEHPLGYYLSKLESNPSACLISSDTAKTHGLKPGSKIAVKVNDKQVMLQVCGLIDYWPSWNPNPSPDQPALIVANLSYLRKSAGLQPYQVWMKLKPDAPMPLLDEEMKKNGISVIGDTRAQTESFRNDPSQMAFNGLPTIGFLTSGLLCLMGCVLFWVLSLRSRTLQFGTLRAMGLTAKQLRRVIFIEQFLTTGAGIVFGIAFGFAASRLFLPFFQSAFYSTLQEIPFRVVSYASDLTKVIVFVGVTLCLGVGILVYVLSKLKISSAIKLGED